MKEKYLGRLATRREELVWAVFNHPATTMDQVLAQQLVIGQVQGLTEALAIFEDLDKEIDDE